MSRLLLVPTRLELARLPDAPAAHAVLAGGARWRGFELALCGFGLVDAAVGAMAALARVGDVELCVLAGLAGTFYEELPVGAVCEGASFRVHGLGVETDAELLDAGAMDLPATATGTLPLTTREEATAELSLDWVLPVELLTVAAASGDLAQAAWRRQAYPEARAEEMEAWAVARAMRHEGVPFTCVRAISNVAGDRDTSRWDAAGAMAALAEALEAIP